MIKYFRALQAVVLVLIVLTVVDVYQYYSTSRPKLVLKCPRMPLPERCAHLYDQKPHVAWEYCMGVGPK
jgi:hypothetical protein